MLYHARIGNEAQGPWPLRDIVLMSGVSPRTPVCPELEIGAWRSLEDELRGRKELAFLLRVKVRAEDLLQTNRSLREKLSGQISALSESEARRKDESSRLSALAEELKKNLDAEKAAKTSLELELQAARVKAVKNEERRKEAEEDLSRAEESRKALKIRAESLERELGEIRRLSSDGESARARIEALREQIESSRLDLVRAEAVKEARTRQIEEMRVKAEEAQRSTADAQARLKAFEVESALTEKSLRGEIEAWKLSSEKSSTAAEERGRSIEELRVRLEGAAARAEESEKRLRAAESSAVAKSESESSRQETMLIELDKSRLLAAERARTIEELRKQFEAISERTLEAENRLRLSQTKFSGEEIGLREEKESLVKRLEAEKGRRERAEEGLDAVRIQLAKLEAKGGESKAEERQKIEELEGTIKSLQQDLLRKSSAVERLETRVAEMRPPPVTAAVFAQEPEAPAAASKASSEKPPARKEPERNSPRSPLSENAPTVEIGPTTAQKLKRSEPGAASSRNSLSRFLPLLSVLLAAALAGWIFLRFLPAKKSSPAPKKNLNETMEFMQKPEKKPPPEPTPIELPPIEEIPAEPAVLKPLPKSRAPARRAPKRRRTDPSLPPEERSPGGIIPLPGYTNTHDPAEIDQEE